MGSRRVAWLRKMVFVRSRAGFEEYPLQWRSSIEMRGRLRRGVLSRLAWIAAVVFNHRPKPSTRLKVFRHVNVRVNVWNAHKNDCESLQWLE